jgi:ubiquitin-conjugating enzyme E2 A
MAQKRLQLELNKIQKNPVEGFTLTKYDDLMYWEGIMDGPSDTPFETGKFKIRFKFENTYPFSPPSVQFLQPIFHPNIYRDGKICIDILQGDWSPAQNVGSIIQSLRSLLMDPNPTSPANRDASTLYLENKDEYIKKVISMIRENQ